MKQLLLLACLVVLTSNVYSQAKIENPETGFNTATYLTLESLELQDSATILNFKLVKRKDWSFAIPKLSYIQEIGKEDRLYVKKSIGVELSKSTKMPESGEFRYSLIFPPVDKSVKYIDFGEGNDGGDWFIYDINLSNDKYVCPVPDKLKGDWFDNESQLWKLGLYDKAVVYDSNLWKYGSVYAKKNSGEIEIIDSSGRVNRLFYKVKKDGLYLGKSKDDLILLTRGSALSDKPLIPDNSGFDEPFFRIDTGIYRGFVLNYDPRCKTKTFKVHLNDVFVGRQQTYVATIDENGGFYVEIPMYSPTEIYINSDFYRADVFLEPGKELFHVQNTGSRWAEFQGDLAAINLERTYYDHIISYNYSELMDTILHMNAWEYKMYLISQWDKDLNKLDEISNRKNICKKAYMIEKRNIDYRYASAIIYYKNYYESAYRKKNNIPRTQRELDINLEPLNVEYFDFLTNDFVNDPYGAISNDYFSVSNRIKYCEPLRNIRLNFKAGELYDGLVQDGYSFTEKEMELIEFYKSQDYINELPEVKAYIELSRDKMAPFYRKCMQHIPRDEMNGKNPSEVAELYKAKGFELTKDEEELVRKYLEYIALEPVKERMEFAKNNSEVLNAFAKKTNAALNNYYRSMRDKEMERILIEDFNIELGLMTNIFKSQDILRKVVSEFTPLSDEDLADAQKQVDNKFISDYIAYSNEATLRKIKSQKNKLGFVVNDVPETEGDKLFEAIMKKYRGKAVYVDFWATWCGPCRSGIERIKPLKEEMDTSKVAFVYITGPSSPENTWNNMIPDIKGEHYRVSKDEWNYLCGKFEISGIPHYVFVGKDGEVINPHLPHLQNSQIKALIEKETE
ncbi:TlpA family protein disulfide reductase [Saccharicrinis sp. FJH2]|uniref:TlpA family protein disulfide reductase n=1 Tax=Saccharicrinis sp. FJH65 TaxID=3344659 RepID=UPI0035F40BF8